MRCRKGISPRNLPNLSRVLKRTTKGKTGACPYFPSHDPLHFVCNSTAGGVWIFHRSTRRCDDDMPLAISGCPDAARILFIAPLHSGGAFRKLALGAASLFLRSSFSISNRLEAYCCAAPRRGVRIVAGAQASLRAQPPVWIRIMFSTPEEVPEFH